MGLYDILKASKLGAGAAPDLYTALLAQKINKGGSGGEAELSGVLPLTFRSNGTPLIDYLISGNMIQSGTPTHESPVMPQGTGERTGNLWGFHLEQTLGGVTLSWNGEKISYSGTCTSSQNFTMDIKLKAGTYTLKANANRNPVDNDHSCIDIYRASPLLMAIIPNRKAVEGSKTFTIDEDMDAVLRIRVHVGVNYDGFEIRPMLNLGSTALPYEPNGFEISISSAGQTNNIYLGEVQSTRRIKKLVLTGEEQYVYASQDDNRYVCSLNIGTLNMSNVVGVCSHFVWKINYDISDYNRIVRWSDTMFYLSLAKDLLDEISIDGFKAYLQQQYSAGTPVTVWYVLAESETGIVNEPLRKIGDYADTLSMEQASVQIPTNRGNTVIDVLTELKPSEVYIKYHTR